MATGWEWWELALAGALVAFVAWGLWGLRRRPDLGPTPYWIIGWIAAGAAGVLLLASSRLAHLQLLAFPLATLFPFLLLAGATALAGRRAPPWLLPAALALGLARAGLAAAGRPDAAYGLALAVEPAVALAAAWVVHRAVSGPGAALAERLLGPSFVVLALAGAGHLVWLMLGLDPDPVLAAGWMVVTPPTLGLQIYALADRERSAARRARDDLERRVETRTRELAETNLALRSSEERYRAVSELSSDFSFAVRVDRELNLSVEWITGAFQRIVGEYPQKLAGRGWLALLAPETLHRSLEELPAARPGGRTVREVAIRTADGEERRLELRAHARSSERAGELRVVGAARDVTDAHRSEVERRELERRMHESQRLESLGRLSGGIAHDFNNLLSVVLGNARLAGSELDDPEKLRARLARIRTAGEHAARLTEQMLTYAGKAPTHRKVIDLSALVRDMEELVRAALPDRCELSLALEPGLRIEADETQIRQVVLNLVTNAGEALQDGAGRVALATAGLRASMSDRAAGRGARDAEPVDYAVLEVRDTGCGMDEETRERIFEPFFSTKFTGRGMGLASVLGIVRSHGGVTHLDSELGRGTGIRVLLPRVRHEEPERPAVDRADRAEEAAPDEGVGGADAAHRVGRILVVDDESDVLELAEQFLRREGFEVVVARGGREGIERLRAEADRIDAVVLDLSMPELGGEPTFLEMRALRPALPIVLATGYSEELASQRFRARGAAGFLHKPYEPEDLAASVRSALAARRRPS